MDATLGDLVAMTAATSSIARAVVRCSGWGEVLTDENIEALADEAERG